eukprot:1792049-Pleurochrysis_carterae.AAC.2
MPGSAGGERKACIRTAAELSARTCLTSSACARVMRLRVQDSRYCLCCCGVAHGSATASELLRIRTHNMAYESHNLC